MYLWRIARWRYYSHVVMEANIYEQPVADNHKYNTDKRIPVPPVRKPYPVRDADDGRRQTHHTHHKNLETIDSIVPKYNSSTLELYTYAVLMYFIHKSEKHFYLKHFGVYFLNFLKQKN